MKPLRVLVVEDSLTVLERLLEALEADPQFEVVGHCHNGNEAIRLVDRHEIDVISLDMVLPGANGLEITRRVVESHKIPIVIVSASSNRGEVFNTLDALSAGAVDVFEKSRITGDPKWAEDYRAVLRMASRIPVIRRPGAVNPGGPGASSFGRSGVTPAQRGTPVRPPTPAASSLDRPSASFPVDDSNRRATPPRTPTTGDREPEPSSSLGRRRALVAIGASTGGPAAVAELLQALPQDFAYPILLVIHLAEMFASTLAAWLARQSGREVRLAADGEPLPPARPGAPVLLAPPTRHMIVRDGRIRLLDTPEVHSCRPSVDVLFDSVALSVGPAAIGVLLTGMGRDGASGLLALKQRGASTVCQDESSSVVFGMPKVAIELGAADVILPLSQIAPHLTEISRRSTTRNTA